MSAPLQAEALVTRHTREYDPRNRGLGRICIELQVLLPAAEAERLIRAGCVQALFNIPLTQAERIAELEARVAELEAAALLPTPESLLAIERERLDYISKHKKLSAEAGRLGVCPVFGDTVRSNYGKLIGVRPLPAEPGR